MILLEILETKGISKLQLACKCGMATTDLYSAINGNKPFYPKWRKRISEYLEVDEQTLFDGKKLRNKEEDN